MATQHRLNLDLITCLTDPATAYLMRTARRCRCGSYDLRPVCDCDAFSPTFVVACDKRGEIEGDAPDLRRAIANWNRRALPTAP
jgi:hypothetical protein